MKKLKTQKGITLVALIITIIVLLILAVVAIGAVQDDGIINYAKNARQQYEKAQINEQTTLNDYLDILNENDTNNVKWTQNGLTVTNGAKKLTVGDTVNYKPGEGSIYTGAWKVLGAENGELLIMTEGYVTDSFLLDGSRGWDTETKSYKAELNALDEECANKVKIEGTKATKVRSVKVDDIDRVVKYDPTNVNGVPYGSGKAYQYGNKVRYYLNSGRVASESKTPDGTVTASATTSNHITFLHPDKRMLIAEGGTATQGYTGVTEIEVISDSYYYLGNTYLDTTSNAYKLLFGNWDSDVEEADKTYWLASPSVYAASSNANFGLRRVKSGNVSSHTWWYSTNNSPAIKEYGVCAVVSLSTDFQV